MEKLFLTVFNLSITASYLIAAVIAARLILRKAPKNIYCFLWFLVGLRLVFPFSVESVFSLIPERTIVQEDLFAIEGTPAINYGLPQKYGNTTGAPIEMQSGTDNAVKEQNQAAFYIAIAAKVWIAGMIVLAVYLVISWNRLKRKVCTAVPCMYGDIKYYRCDNISSPFLFGLFAPKIYVPTALTACLPDSTNVGLQRNMPDSTDASLPACLPDSTNISELAYVLKHELAHRRRKDYMIKPIAYLLLMVYWFNPFVWVAYILLCRDIELACDEYVIKELGTEYRKEYSQALLACSVNRRTIAACPVAFGEIGVKQRIKNVINYRKPTFWVLIAAAAACVVIVVCFMTQKNSDTEDIVQMSEEGEAAKDAPTDITLEQINASPVFTLYLPEALVDKLSFNASSDLEVSINTADEKYSIGRLYGLSANDITDNKMRGEFYFIGNYGANASLKAYYENLAENATLSEKEVPNITDPEAKYEGVIAIPNADGSISPVLLPNAEDNKFEADSISEFDTPNTEQTSEVAQLCYIFVPDKNWTSEREEELAQLLSEFLNHLEDIQITETSVSQEVYKEVLQSWNQFGHDKAVEEIQIKNEELEKKIEQATEELKQNDLEEEQKERLAELLDSYEEERAALQNVLEQETTQLEVQKAKEEKNAQQAVAFVTQWAEAFCDRDGAAIIKMADIKTRQALSETMELAGGINSDGKAYTTFGWSSPWPWGSGESQQANYQILYASKESAAILYYAWTSDPHVTVWREDLSYQKEGDSYQITFENLTIYDNICDIDEFYIAYPDGVISGTMMDYFAGNGVGEALNENAKKNKHLSGNVYHLFEPDTAAVNLLNLLHNENKVKTFTEYTNADKTEATVTILFVLSKEGHNTVSVQMIKPYGNDGIWVPQSAIEANTQGNLDSLENYMMYNSGNIIKEFHAANENVEALFPAHHENQENTSYSIDLNGDGTEETITMTDLHYNGGDGGYAVSVKSGGKELSMPDGYAEDGFGFYAKYAESDDNADDSIILKVYTREDEPIAMFTQGALYALYEEKRSITDYKRVLQNMPEVYVAAGDAVSGFAVSEVDGVKTLCLKSYISGVCGHADCLGYAVTCMQLNEKNEWTNIGYYFMLDGQ